MLPGHCKVFHAVHVKKSETNFKYCTIFNQNCSVWDLNEKINKKFHFWIKAAFKNICTVSVNYREDVSIHGFSDCGEKDRSGRVQFTYNLDVQSAAVIPQIPKGLAQDHFLKSQPPGNSVIANGEDNIARSFFTIMTAK